MASSSHVNQFTIEENVGANIAHSLEIYFKAYTYDDSKSIESVEFANLTTTNDVTMDNIVRSGTSDLVSNTSVENIALQSQQQRTINEYLQNFGLVTERLQSTINNTNPTNDPILVNNTTLSRSRAVSPIDVRFNGYVDHMYHSPLEAQMARGEMEIFELQMSTRHYTVDCYKIPEQLNNIIREYKESINRNNHHLYSLTKEELTKLTIQLRNQLFNDTLSTSEDHKILRNLFDQSRNLTELLNKISETLRKRTGTDIKTIVKLTLAYIFVWTVKTHIAPAYLKHK